MSSMTVYVTPWSSKRASSSSFRPPRNFNQNRADRSAPLGRRAPQERLMAARTQTVDWQRKQYRGRHRRLVWPCLSLGLRDRCDQSHRQECFRALSMIPARSHSAPPGGFGRTARVMAALWRRRVFWISSFHLCWSDFADISWPMRLDAMSAAYCSVRVTAGCGRPSALQTRESMVKALVARVWDCNQTVFDQTLPALRHLEPLLHWEWQHTSSRTASWDSSGSEKISRPGLRKLLFQLSRF